MAYAASVNAMVFGDSLPPPRTQPRRGIRAAASQPRLRVPASRMGSASMARLVSPAARTASPNIGRRAQLTSAATSPSVLRGKDRQAQANVPSPDRSFRQRSAESSFNQQRRPSSSFRQRSTTVADMNRVSFGAPRHSILGVSGEHSSASAEPPEDAAERCADLSEELHRLQREGRAAAAAECARELARLVATGRTKEDERLASLLRLLARLHLDCDETDEALGAAGAALELQPDMRAHWTNSQVLQRARQLQPAGREQLAAYALGMPQQEEAMVQLLNQLQRTRQYHNRIAPKERPSSGFRRCGWHGRGETIFGPGASLHASPPARVGSASPSRGGSRLARGATPRGARRPLSASVDPGPVQRVELCEEK
jgi:hypothetical protein